MVFNNPASLRLITGSDASMLSAVAVLTCNARLGRMTNLKFNCIWEDLPLVALLLPANIGSAVETVIDTINFKINSLQTNVGTFFPPKEIYIHYRPFL